MKCWNCLTDNGKKSHRCSSCDQPLKPNAAQTVTSKRNVDYLLHEIQGWAFLKPPEMQKVEAVYSARLARLADAASSESLDKWPLSDWSEEPLPTAVDVVPEEVRPEPVPAIATNEKPTRSVAEPLEIDAPPEGPIPVAPREKSLVATLVGEADIRWFHSLGALLVVAAVIGWLRASWDSYGKALAGLLIASSPLILHFVAHRLKKSVPLSSRLLAILANLLTPPALLALDIFGALPDFVPGPIYWTCSLLVSAAILSWQAEKTHEKVPLYIGALCAVMAGWSQGALLTALCSLAVGFLFAWDTETDEPQWAEQRKTVSFYAGSFGALTTLALFDTAGNPLLPVSAFTAALVFLHLPTLTGQVDSASGSRVFMQTALTLVGSILMRAVLGVPAGGVALYLVFASALFLAAKPESKVAAGTAKIASALGTFALIIGFLSDLPAVLASQQSLHQAGLRFLFTAVGTGYFWMSSRKTREEQSLFLLGLFTLLGGWVHLLLFAVTRRPIEGPDQFAPLLASLPIFATALLLATKRMRESEIKTTCNFLAPLLAGSLAVTAVLRLTSPGQAVTWEAILLLQAATTLIWERGWLLNAPSSLRLAQALPRLTLIATTLLLLTAPGLQAENAFFAAASALTVASFVLRNHYRQACFELAWITFWLGLPVSDHRWLLIGALLSFALALSDRKRQTPAMVGSTAYSLAALLLTAGEYAYPMLFLPALVFAVTQYVANRTPLKEATPPKHRAGFDILLAAAVLLGGPSQGGNVESVGYCVLLAAMAFGFAVAWKRKPSQAELVLSVHSSPVLFGALLVWSLGRTTLETGLLLMLASVASHLFLNSQHKAEVCNALAISGAAQVAADSHFILDPVIVGAGLLLSETLTLVTRRPSTQFSNLVLLIIACVQGQPSFLQGWTAELLLPASLMLALRSVQQDLYPTAIVAGVVFLWKVDPFLAKDLDLKYRLIPMACVFIGCAVWKWKRDFSWIKPLLHIGLALLVTPACLQFILGSQLGLNFTWMLAFGCAYLALSFVLPESFRHSFRQAGGYTLTAWAAVSLTRVALELPWQAATLMIGLALVTVGIVVERRHRHQTPDPDLSADERVA